MNHRTLAFAAVAAITATACGIEPPFFTRSDGIEIAAGGVATIDLLDNDELPAGARLLSVESRARIGTDPGADGDVTITIAPDHEPGDAVLTYIAGDAENQWSGTLVVRTIAPPDVGDIPVEDDDEGGDSGPSNVEQDPPVGPAFGLSRSRATFASSTVGSNGQSAAITITNEGTEDLDPTFSVDGPFYSTLRADCPTVPVATECEFRVGIRATDAGSFAATMTVAADGTPSVTVVLRGDVDEARPGFDFSLTASQTELSRDDRPATGFVTNTAEDPVSDITLTSNTDLIQILDNECAEATLEAEEVCSFTFDFDTERIDFESGSAAITATSEGEERTLPITYAWDPQREVSLSAGSLNFPDNFRRTITIRNTGEVDIDRPANAIITGIGVSAATLQASVDPDFCATTIGPGDECPLHVDLITWPGNGTEPVTLTLSFGGALTRSLSITFEPVG